MARGRDPRDPSEVTVVAVPPGTAGPRRLSEPWSPPVPAARLLVGAGAVLAAAAIGLSAALNPLLATVGLIGLMVIALVLSNITAGLMVLILVAYLEALPTIPGGPSLSKLVGLFLVVGWLTAVVVGRANDRLRHQLGAFDHLLAWALGLFVAWVLFSLLWAEDTSVARESFLRFAPNIAIFAIVLTAVRQVRHVVWLYTAVIGGALITSAAGYLLSSSASDARLYGVGINPNELGGLTAASTVLAGALACNRAFSVSARLTALFASFLCAVSMLLTGSRGSLLGLGVALLLTPVVAGRGRRLVAGGLVMSGALALVVWLLTLAPPDMAARVHRFDSSGSGRADLWQISRRIIEDRPLIGVGAGNFPVASVHYLLEPGAILRDEFIVDRPQEAHNIYLQVLTELGVIGLVLFLTIVASCLAAALRAARTFRRLGRTGGDILARGLFLALVALLVTNAFTTTIYGKQLYILLAIGPAMLAIAERSRAESPG
jgi:O-antigen ligase